MAPVSLKDRGRMNTSEMDESADGIAAQTDCIPLESSPATSLKIDRCLLVMGAL